MAKKQKKKQPITTRVQPTDAKFKHSRVETARLIRRFHVLNKELAKCRAEPSPANTTYEQDILKEMEAMGGLDWYQKASQLGQSKTRGGDSSKWLIQTLKSHCKEQLDTSARPLKVLDIGAVAPDNYKPYSSWITAKPIDLNPQHPDIQKQDFLKMTPPSTDETRFDIVCLSLVINFVGDPKDRGQMLIHTRHFLTSPSISNRLHYLFLVVPLPCIDNSRYMTHEHLLSMMTSIGYTKCIHHHFSNKLAYYLFELTTVPSTKNISWKKKILPGKEGGARNNFAVVIE
ncbi:putative methyltransferase-domain-containing protein [Helicostylum pulchrum]|uniref:25S rRNA adenine-N(1) methyltransferase n=1 Tax=Helicostylum pulchrum TaxID=562976 RepID=A0ABP9YFB9_9FUNG|nr:putative methyltransferase-domain-containing protein [Helicostylum pulchrum]